MRDLIDRQAAIDVLDAYQVKIENGEENPYAWARLRMSELPSAESQEHTGKWILHKNGDGTCNQCHFRQSHIWDLDNWQNYCGHCGAHMTEAGGEDGGGA